MLDGSRHTPREARPPGLLRVFRARLANGSAALSELDPGEAERIHRRWLAKLDERAASLILGKPSDDVARRVLELAESYLEKGDGSRAITVLSLVADSKLFVGTQEHALASAALKNLRHRPC